MSLLARRDQVRGHASGEARHGPVGDHSAVELQEVKLVATMAAHMYPHIDGGPAQAVETAQLILQETHKAIDADLEPELAEPKPAGEVS